MCNLKTHRVLYVVGRAAPTSVPLEVAHFLEHDTIQLRVVAFTRTDYHDEVLEAPLVRIGAQHRLDWHAIKRLYACIAEFHPEVIHVHHTVSAFWASLFGRLHGAKVVRSEHNNADFRTTGQQAINTVSQALADLILCNSQNTYRSLPEWKKRLVGDRWKVVYNGVDIQRIERAASGNPPFKTERSPRITIGSVGRLIDQKNYGRLLQAFSEVVSMFERKCRLILVGDGANRPDLERKIDRLGLSDHVTLTGEVDRDDVYAALHTFDVFVMPSLWEGFCNALVEAMAAGLPVVCSDIPTLREVAGNTAIYADPTDPSSMSGALSHLLDQGRESWQQRGEEARQWAIERYPVERTAEEYVEAYFDVAEGRSS